MFGRKAAVIAATSLFGVALLGSAALAAFAPTPADTSVDSLVPQIPGVTAGERGQKPGAPADRLKAILDALVQKGVITQAQEDSILAAVKDADADKRKDEHLRHVFADLFAQSATYLGLTGAELKAKLPGASLGAIANVTAGKSRDGLVLYLTKAANDAIAKLLADNKITKQQADKATAEVPEHINKFVDHKFPEAKPRATRGPSVHAFIADATKVARDYLGLTEEALKAQLRAGKSLGEIATATTGKSRDGLVAALTQEANNRLDKAKADGKITADQLLALQSQVSKAVNELVDHKVVIKSR